MLSRTASINRDPILDFDRPGLLILTGPTAVGKTSLSLEIAEKLGWEILSCDAFCVYRGMDIGTAKPTEVEQQRVRHWGIDLVPVRSTFDVARYQEYALTVAREAKAHGRGLVVSGGSGFYLRSFLGPVVDGVVVPDEIKKEVSALFANKGLAGMVEVLKELNPEGVGGLDLCNPRRVERALMRCLASGTSLGSMERAFRQQPDPFADWDRRVLLLQRDTASLHKRVRERVAAMIRDGLINEVHSLREQGILQNPTASRAIGYRETLKWLENPTTIPELEEEITIHTRQLARKQRTWFRHQLRADRVVMMEA